MNVELTGQLVGQSRVGAHSGGIHHAVAGKCYIHAEVVRDNDLPITHALQRALGHEATIGEGARGENTGEAAGDAPTAASLQREELAEAHLDAFAQAHRLSPREREILGLISKGRDVPYIEQELVLSKSTVKTHIRHIYEKCEVSSRRAMRPITPR